MSIARVCFLAVSAVILGLLPIFLAWPDQPAALAWGAFIVLVGVVFIRWKIPIGRALHLRRILWQHKMSEEALIRQAMNFGINLILVGSVSLAGVWMWGARSHSDAVETERPSDVGAVETERPNDAGARLESIFSDLPSTMNEEILTESDFVSFGEKIVEADQVTDRMKPNDIPALIGLLVDSSRNIWARGQVINVVDAIQKKYDPRWETAPIVDYEGLIRVAADKTEDKGIRCDAIELLSRWRHRPAAVTFRSILNDPAEETSVIRCAVRFHGMVDTTATELPDDLFDQTTPHGLRLDWFSFADNADLSETSILRLSSLIWDADLGVSNRAISAVGAQSDMIVVDILASALVKVARHGNLHYVSSSLIVRGLLRHADTRSIHAAETAIDVAADSGNLDLIEEIVTEAAEIAHPRTDQFIARAVRAVSLARGREFDGARLRARLQEAKQFGEFRREYHRTGVAKEDNESFEDYFRRVAKLPEKGL